MTKPTTESGNLYILGIGMWVVALVLIMVLASAITIHNERKELFAQADALALDVANDISDESYYTGVVTISDDAVATRAAERAAQLPGTTLTGASGGDTVTITLRRVVPVPFVPSFIDAFDEVAIEVTSVARLREMP